MKEKSSILPVDRSTIMRYQIYLRKEASENLELMSKASGLTPSQLLKMWIEPNLTFKNLRENILRVEKEERETKKNGRK